MAIIKTKWLNQTVRILCQCLAYCESDQDGLAIGFADGSVYSRPELIAAVKSALKDCPLLTVRYTSPEATNTFKGALSLKDLQAITHLSRTQVCYHLANERQLFIKQLKEIDVLKITECAKHSVRQRVSGLDGLFTFPRRKPMKV